MMRSFLFPLVSLFLVSAPVMAQSNPDKNEPLEITANQTLEWHRNDNKYIARGAAEARQGTFHIKAETLTADYRETAQTNYDIYRMSADNDVVITSQGNQAFGEKAVYEIDSGMATMTGEGLKMITPDQVLTARDKFEYAVNEGRLSAYGDVVIIRGEDKLQADKASAFFSTTENGSSGQRKLERFEGEGHVVVTTPTEVLTGNRGIYRADSNIAEVIGNVKIKRGPNILEGDRAEINLTTNVSRMFGNQTTTTSGGRVKGTFYPSSNDQKQQTAPAPASTPAPVSTTPPPSGQGVTVIPDESPAAIPPPLTSKPTGGRLTAP